MYYNIYTMTNRFNDEHTKIVCVSFICVDENKILALKYVSHFCFIYMYRFLIQHCLYSQFYSYEHIQNSLGVSFICLSAFIFSRVQIQTVCRHIHRSRHIVLLRTQTEIDSCFSFYFFTFRSLLPYHSYIHLKYPHSSKRLYTLFSYVWVLLVLQYREHMCMSTEYT